MTNNCKPLTGIKNAVQTNASELKAPLAKSLKRQAAALAFNEQADKNVLKYDMLFEKVDEDIEKNLGLDPYKQIVESVTIKPRDIGNIDYNFLKENAKEEAVRSNIDPLDVTSLVKLNENFQNISTNENAVLLYTSLFNNPDNTNKIQIQCQDTNNVKNTIEQTLSNQGSILYDISNTYNNYRTSFKSGIESYKTLYTYFDSISAIKKELENKLNRLNNKTNILEQNINIDDRKDKYNYNNLNFYNKIYSWLFILYYILFILYLFFSNFFPDKKYLEATYQFLIIIYILFPFILKYLLNYIYDAYIYILKMFYLKNDEISYQNIVEESEHILNDYNNKIDRNEIAVEDLIKKNI